MQDRQGDQLASSPRFLLGHGPRHLFSLNFLIYTLTARTPFSSLGLRTVEDFESVVRGLIKKVS